MGLHRTSLFEKYVTCTCTNLNASSAETAVSMIICSEEERDDSEASVSLLESKAAINKAQQVLQLSLPVGEPDAGPGVSANSALSIAAGLAARAAPLVTLAEWVRMPSNAAQNWVRYTALGVASGWAALFLYRCTAPAPLMLSYLVMQTASQWISFGLTVSAWYALIDSCSMTSSMTRTRTMHGCSTVLVN